MELKEGIKQINQSVTQSSASDATLEGYMLELKDANGNLVDKQPVSKLENLIYNYLTTKRQSELATAVGGLLSLDAFNKDFNIETSVFDGVSYADVNYQLSFTGRNESTVWAGTYPYQITGGEKLLHFIVGNAYRCQILIPRSGLPATRVYYGKWHDWQTLPSFYKDYSDIASLAGGLNAQNFKDWHQTKPLGYIKIPRPFNVTFLQERDNKYDVIVFYSQRKVTTTETVTIDKTIQSFYIKKQMYPDQAAKFATDRNYLYINVTYSGGFVYSESGSIETSTQEEFEAATPLTPNSMLATLTAYNSLSELKDALKAIW